MAKVETAVARESSKWENGKWKFGIKARIPRSIVVLRNFTFVNIAWDTRRVVKYWEGTERNVCGGIHQDTKYIGKCKFHSIFYFFYYEKFIKINEVIKYISKVKIISIVKI